MDDSRGASTQPARLRWRTILLLVGAVVALVFASVWFLPSPDVLDTPVQCVRGEDGRMAPVNAPETSNSLSLEMHAGAIEAANNFSSTAIATRSDHAGFTCSHLVIFNRSGHLLMERVGELLLEKLKPATCFQQIDYYPAGFEAQQGERAPDMVVTLDLEKLEEGGLLVSRRVKARIAVAAGNDAPGCSNSYSDHLTPPIVCLQWSGTLEHSSTTTGVSSSAAKYKLVAENIAAQIADSLIKEFQQRLEKEGTLPELPEAFYPPYRPAPDLPLAGFGKTEIVSSWHGLLNHNETLWRLDLDGSAIDFFNEMPQRLEAAGWKKSSSDKQYLRFTHSAATLVAYVPSQQKPLLDAPANEPFLYVQYVDRMTQDEVRAAIDQALAAGVSTDVLIHFERQWSQEQSQRILEMFKTQPARTPSASLTVAKLYHRLKQDDNAREELVRTRALLRTVAEYGDLQDNLKKLAKELGDEKLAEQPIDTKVFLELGFAELKPGESIAAQEIGLEEPVHFFVKNSEGELETISVRAVKAPSTDTDPCQLAFVQSGEHGRSWGTSGLSHSLRFRDRYCATFSLTPLADSGRFRLEVRLSEN